MKLNTALLFISYYMLLVNCSIKVPKVLKCDNEYKFKWLLSSTNSSQCLNIIIGSILIPKCYFDQIFNSKFIMQINDLNSIKSRNVWSLQHKNCNNFMFFIENPNEILELFAESNNTLVKRFLPFSQLFFVSPNLYIEFDRNSLNYIYENGLYVYVILSWTSDVLSFQALRNVLTDDILNLMTSNASDAIRYSKYFGTYKDHPVFNMKKYKEKEFRVSLFDCSPYIVFLPDGKFDGLEYRVLREITKDWRIKLEHNVVNSTVNSPYGLVREQIQNHESDLGMCSVWLSTLTYYTLDLTNYITLECSTFMVPKSKLLNPSTYLYISIGADVWCCFAISLIAVALSVTILAKIGSKFIENAPTNVVYVDFSRSLMDTFKVSTCQGLGKFQMETSLRTVFNSWIVANLLFGVVFSTGYTSLLTKPPFSKPIDTVVDVLANDLYFDIRGKSNISHVLNDSGVVTYIQLAKQYIQDDETRKKYIENEKLVYFVKILSSDYISNMEKSTDPDFKLRIMKSCFFKYYTVVALQKFSPYTQYFNDKIGMLHQSGIISHWGSLVNGANNTFMHPYFNKFGEKTRQSKRISLHNLSGSFLFLLTGLWVAAIVFIVEKFQYYCKNSVKNETINTLA